MIATLPRGADQVFRRLWEVLPASIVVINSRLNVVLANRSACCVFGLSRDQLEGAPLSSLIPHKELPSWISDSNKTEEPKVIELHPESVQERFSTRVLRMTILPLSRKTLSALLLEDVSEKVLLEEQLVHSEKLAALGQLAQGVAHELGNPLSSIASSLEHLREGLIRRGDSGPVEVVDIILDNLNQMHHLLLTLSNFSKGHRARYEPTDLQRLILQSMAFIGWEAERREIRLVTSFDSSLLPCQVDVRRIKQVLLNILKNALESMPHGGEISVRTCLGTMNLQDGPAAIIEIRDTGVGIGEQELGKVFRPLYSTKPNGMGLGLSFCREVIEGHGGEIRITSRKTGGTKVTLALPL